VESKAFGEVDYKEKAKEALINEIKKICDQKLQLANTDTPIAPNEVGGTGNARNQEIYQMIVARSDNDQRVPSATPVEDEVDRFFSQNLINWKSILASTPSCPEHVVDEIGSDRIQYVMKWDIISEHFDIMDWWENTGRVQFPLIYIIACIILPLPDSNGSQERTFSSATWMDGKLNKRQSDATFQMKVILQQNYRFLQQERLLVQIDLLKAAEESTKSMINRATEQRQKEIDGEIEDYTGYEDDPDDEDTVSVLVTGKDIDSDECDDVDDDEEAAEELYD
jgi:hypothetical protein